MRNYIAASFLVAAIGCGGRPDNLAPEAVQSIPPGDARGTALSGSYRIERVTLACSGTCGGLTAGGYPFSVCDVGDVDGDSATVTQADGRLTTRVHDTPAVYSGGVNSDGTVALGGFATQAATLNIAVRLDGTLTTAGFRGSARSHTWGSYGATKLDCWGDHEITPEK